MKLLTQSFLSLAITGLLFSCSSDDEGTDMETILIEAPTTYSFERDGESTVSFSGQTTRIAMAEELVSNLTDPNVTIETLKAQFSHKEGENNFNNANLNNSDKNIRSKVAASFDLFGTNATEGTAIKSTFQDWIERQYSEVFPRWEETASAGVAGSIEEGGSNPPTRYVTAKGLELNQAFAKSLIGALMVDQAINNYLSPGILDEADNRENNTNGVTVEGKSYTNMEHKWDEAYGYVYGASADKENPNTTIGEDDSFLNKYIGRVENDEDYAGIATEIYNAFKLGRAAIVAGNYEVRDEQAGILKNKISEIIAIRAIYYLQQGKSKLESGTIDYADVFHDLSEGYGFIYSLQFTRNDMSSAALVNGQQVEGWLNQILPGTTGFWEVTPEDLQTVSENIATIYGITISEAGS
ncbi:DUF4856 domain-containing protein [Aquimarina sp. ERC-38]|uniref:DUF4856 domain-containing protein n=1 Tax=Aquimarina sp. ERC-38 TaxID=2949996 RepID=UPI0022450BA1|nr:DUF4856 domain-containing protein [Aquimarina sp. ERC-38]UZO80431.1 DUF4856 domain-containing protein [Aquimarina sp. ERC-38]